MTKYYCPKCKALLNSQNQFNPLSNYWECEECGILLEKNHSTDTFSIYYGSVTTCAKCNSVLDIQPKFSEAFDKGYWYCTKCGQLNTDPSLDIDADIVYICDECGALLNIQKNFNMYRGFWTCTECGTIQEEVDITQD